MSVGPPLKGFFVLILVCLFFVVLLSFYNVFICMIELRKFATLGVVYFFEVSGLFVLVACTCLILFLCASFFLFLSLLYSITMPCIFDGL